MVPKEITDKKILISMDYLAQRRVSPEDTNKLHYHPYHEFLILNNGFITYATDNGIVKIADKSIVFMPAHTLHNPFVQDTHPYERYIIRFYPDFADGIISQPDLLAQQLKNSYIKQLSNNDYDEIYSIVKSMYKIVTKDNKDNSDKLNECIQLSSVIFKGNNATSIPITPNSTYITDVVEYIKGNYNKPLTIQLLADHFFVSKSKLTYDFNNYCRISVLEYITMTRIEAAKEHLLKGWSVAATSDTCGFSTSSYFIKVFSKITGLTPLKFQMKYNRF